MTHQPVAPDHVVTCDDDGNRLGTFARSDVHTTETPLHLAFSCYLLDDDGRLLVTRRALVKKTWPGVWTNSFCGHIRWDETVEQAVDRHADGELGLAVSDLEAAVPDFRYRAVDASGVVENEICPVFVARAVGPVVPNQDELSEFHWVDAADVLRAVDAAPWSLSPWMVWQINALREIPRDERTAGASLLAGALGLS